jgi:O-methyltransferase
MQTWTRPLRSNKVSTTIIVKMRPLHQIRYEMGVKALSGVFHRQSRLYRKYRAFTMMGELAFIENLSLCEKAQSVEGDIVECGTWRGGMSAAMAEILRGGVEPRMSVLFDSFQGLPPPEEADGVKAHEWAQDTTSPEYYDNCTASDDDAHRAMSLSGIESYRVLPGWFEDTLPRYAAEQPKIAVLRLDGDWYQSIMTCLENLFPHVVPGGVVLIDDYGYWDGCTRAVHEFLARAERPEAIQRGRLAKVAFLVKQPD